ncbi:uncharacterized protein LOC126668472 [Mercurialis annua]|uniref:uncharacterized protein LOC126668472 n=1 Tax=Mercurialis annua TaxID=3986 RepID=UPI00216045DF|nr:uncharacterized protein LOC126668472 [Mercurialis annua]
MLTKALADEKEKHKEAINWDSIRNLEKQLCRATIEEELYWAQKSRQDWLNTKYFHAKTKQRQKRNLISGIYYAGLGRKCNLQDEYMSNQTSMEIKDAVFSIHPSMAPGLNHTVISLIPKEQAVITIMDFKPISLCSVYYKIILKILTARLQKIIYQLVRESQNTFIHGRSISDNILLAHEILHFVKHKN